MEKKENIFETVVVFGAFALLIGIGIWGIGMMFYSVGLSDNIASAEILKGGLTIFSMASCVAMGGILHFAENDEFAYGFWFTFLALTFNYLATEEAMASVYCWLNIASRAAVILSVVLVTKGFVNKMFSSY